MGCPAELLVRAHEDKADELIDWGIEQLRRLERLWSRFEPTSEISSLNAHPGTAQVVSGETYSAIDRAVALWRATDGRFDPTVLAALEAVGYDRSFELVRQRSVPRPFDTMPTPGCVGIELDADTSSVKLPPGVRLDLGGVGKGFAADCIAEWLVARGAISVCVGLGGDIRIAGECPIESGWPIPIEDPVSPGTMLCSFPITRGALVMSSTRERRWVTANGRYAHHIIEPSTGRPAETGITAVAVHTDEAWWAEGLAKAALLAGIIDGVDLLHRYGVTAWVITDDQRVITVGDMSACEINPERAVREQPALSSR